MLKLLMHMIWHTVKPSACKRVETHRPYDRDMPIAYTCHGCGRTSKEYT